MQTSFCIDTQSSQVYGVAGILHISKAELTPLEMQLTTGIGMCQTRTREWVFVICVQDHTVTITALKLLYCKEREQMFGLLVQR